jgi:hypothetical protein
MLQKAIGRGKMRKDFFYILVERPLFATGCPCGSTGRVKEEVTLPEPQGLPRLKTINDGML